MTGAALRLTWHHFFVAERSTLDRWNGNNRETRIGTRLSALHSAFPFLKGSLAEFASFLMLSSSKIEEVSQNCFVFLTLSG